MNEQRKAMMAEIQRVVLPELRRQGFRGSFPHLRAQREQWVDLMTFQFDHWGGGLVIEIARCPATGGTGSNRKFIPPNRVRAWDFNDRRKRIQARPGSSTRDWFRYDDQSPTDAALQILRAIENLEIWSDVKIVGLPGLPP